MAKMVLKDAYISVNGTVLSDHFKTIAIEDSADEVDLTAFGANYKEFGQGLKDGSITGEVFQDYDPGSLDAVLYPLYQSGGTFPVIVKPSSAAVGTANPTYTMTARLFQFSPINGSVGEANDGDVTFRNAGTAGIVKAVA